MQVSMYKIGWFLMKVILLFSIFDLGPGTDPEVRLVFTERILWGSCLSHF